MKKNPRIIFPYTPDGGPDESLRPPAPTPIKMDEYQNDIPMEQHVPHPPLVPHAPHAPRPPTGPSQPRRRMHHRVVRPSQAVEVPKIDLSFKSPESDEDSDPTDFDKPQAHTSDMHADVNNAHAYNAALFNTNQMGAFHADRSRTFGMTYLEKAYGRSGFHLPDIKDNQEPVGRNIIKVKSRKPSLINLDLTENNDCQPAAEIKLPAMISHSVKPQAKSSDIEQRSAPGQPVTIDNRRKAAVVELPAIEQKEALAHKVPVPPKHVKPTAMEHLPALAQHRALAHKAFASKQSIASAFEQLPTLTQQATMTRDLLSPRQPKAIGSDQSAAWSPQSLSPKQASAVEYIPSLVAKSPARLSPHGQELLKRQQLSPSAPPMSVASTYGEMASYGPNASLPRYQAFPPSKPTIHFTKNSNAVPSHEPKPPTNPNVESDGTLLIGLEEVHLSPDELESNPSPNPPPVPSPKEPDDVSPNVPNDDQESISSSITPPKVLSITDQIKAFKARQDNHDLHDLRSETSLNAAKAELNDVSTDPLKEEEKRKLKDQVLYKDMIPSKPKPPHHIGTHFVTGPFNIKLAPGEHINVHPGAAKLPPSGLRKRRQPRLRNQKDT